MLIVGTLGTFAVLTIVGATIGTLLLFFLKHVMGVEIEARSAGVWMGYVILPLSSFVSFVFTVKFMIVRKVVERTKQEVHQRYQKLLEEKGIQLEDSNV